VNERRGGGRVEAVAARAAPVAVAVTENVAVENVTVTVFVTVFVTVGVTVGVTVAVVVAVTVAVTVDVAVTVAVIRQRLIAGLYPIVEVLHNVSFVHDKSVSPETTFCRTCYISEQTVFQGRSVTPETSFCGASPPILLSAERHPRNCFLTDVPTLRANTFSVKERHPQN